MRILVLLLLCIPQVSFAAVYISEVAWMGDSASPNNEWIEIYGDESVEGWVLEAEDGTPYIELAGTVSGARVLYRGVEYTGALENGGEVLVLKNSSGVEVDRVDGSDGWSLGGNNESKETLQKVNGSWATGSPSPGSVVVEEVVEENTSVVVEGSTSSYEWSSLELRVPDSFSVIARSETAFEAGFGLTDGTTFDSGLIEWNFGDGTVRRGGHLYHKYHHPGKYIMIVSASNGGEKIEKRVRVSVREVEVQLFRESSELVVLQNNDTKEVEISRWRIRSDNRVFIFPEDTYVVAKGSIGVSSNTAGFVFGSEVVLEYPDGEVVNEVEEKEVPVERVVYRSTPVIEEKEEGAETLPAATVLSAPEESGRVSIYVYLWVVLVLVVGGSIVFIRRYG